MNDEVSKFITIIRPEFMSFCKDACRAASLNHLLFRLAGKCKDQPKEKIQAGEILWYAKNEQITTEMSHAWGSCKIGKEVNELVSMGLLGRTKDPQWGVNRTKHFFFGSEQCATFLKLCDEHKICFVHMDLPDEVKHLIYSSNANDKSIKCICAIHQMQMIDVSDANDRCIEAIYQEDYKDNNEEDNKEREGVAGATAPAQIHIVEISQDDEEKRRAFMTYAHQRVAEANKKSRSSASSTEVKPKVIKKPTAMAEKTPSQEAIRIMDAWDSIFSRKCTRTENHIKAAELLVPCAPTRDDLNNIRKFCYKANPKWYNDKGVSLIDVAKNFDKWQSLQEAPQVSEKNGHSPPGSNGAKPRPSALVSEEQAAKNKARLYAAAAAKQAEKAGGQS